VLSITRAYCSRRTDVEERATTDDRGPLLGAGDAIVPRL
jgi:hypothetical protein